MIEKLLCMYIYNKYIALSIFSTSISWYWWFALFLVNFQGSGLSPIVASLVLFVAFCFKPYVSACPTSELMEE